MPKLIIEQVTLNIYQNKPFITTPRNRLWTVFWLFLTFVPGSLFTGVPWLIMASDVLTTLFSMPRLDWSAGAPLFFAPEVAGCVVAFCSVFLAYMTNKAKLKALSYNQIQSKNNVAATVYCSLIQVLKKLHFKQDLFMKHKCPR